MENKLAWTALTAAETPVNCNYCYGFLCLSRHPSCQNSHVRRVFCKLQ